MQKPPPPVPPHPRAKQKVVFCGWLRKEGGNFRNLRTRWFEIRGDQLYYYKDRNDPRPAGVVPLAGNDVIRHSPDPTDPGKYKFEIVSGKNREGRPVVGSHETFVMIASTIEEMDRWIRVINHIIYKPYGGGMFGSDLAETVKFEARKGGGFVPIVAEICMESIRKNGLKEEGLFRLPGNAKSISLLKARFNRGENPDLTDEKDIHTVASLLKLFLRELSEPVIPYDFFEVFLTSAKCYEMYEEDGITSIKNHLKRLPPPNYNLLKVLSRFLFEVQLNSDRNKMDTRNLAMVFGPNMLRSGSEDPQVMMESTAQVTALISIFIKRHELFFPKTDDEFSYKRPTNSSADSTTANLIDLGSADSPKLGRALIPQSPSGQFTAVVDSTELFPNEDTTKNGSGDDADNYKTQIQELENEVDLQVQQIKDLQTELEKERKVREMLLIRLSDEQRARVGAEDRLTKLNSAMDEFCVKFGGFAFDQ